MTLIQPHFTNLYELIIRESHIDNLEVLQFINAPILSILILDDNQINNLQALKKTSFDQLQFISLTFNHIRSVE